MISVDLPTVTNVVDLSRYMQRRLVKSLEDLCCQYDRTVRNSTGEIIQFVYGADGLDPTYMEAKDRPVDFPRALYHTKAIYPCPEEDPLDEESLKESLNCIMEDPKFKECGEDFKAELMYDFCIYWNCYYCCYLLFLLVMIMTIVLLKLENQIFYKKKFPKNWTFWPE